MPVFEAFHRLPPEVRRMIWRHALPDKDAPALVPYDEKEPDDPYLIDDSDEATAEDIVDELGFWAEQGHDVSLGGGRPARSGPSAHVQEIARRMLAEATGAEQDGRQGDDDAKDVAERAPEQGNETAAGAAQDARDDVESQDEEDEEGDSDESGESDESDESDSSDPGITMTLCRPWIPVHLPPLALVNREARQVLLDYIDDKGMVICRNKIWKSERKLGFHQSEPVFVRRYNPQHDALWVDRLHWPVFVEHMMESKVRQGHDVVTLAVPAFTAYHSTVTLAELFHVMPNIKRVISIWGTLPPLDYLPEQINAAKLIRGKNYKDSGHGGDDIGQVQFLIKQRWDVERLQKGVVTPDLPESVVNHRKGLSDTEWPDADDGEEALLAESTVGMICADPEGGIISIEKDKLGTYLDEIYDVMKSMVLPSSMFDEQIGDISLQVLARQIAGRGGS